ncbi:phosphotransferase enzyme family protein [Umezawaea tangerina]|uniref:Ser/Thr protein kinase RdoA (MazF antagonist) n=1 Tax=Umezawaea tangerina TaxID=84725 RepID=A0A2T0SVU9_9PSEU|nr:phosphotransferase [Umezawaea tangerina]PRY37520.1 Ser/Thr protein kinase RdoA (MazF antagonist) [Umezawaea tangerina]
MPVREKPVSKDFLNLDDRVLGIVVDRYGLPDADCFLPILLDGDRCTLLDVRSDTSKKAVLEAGDKRYFLKQVPWYCDEPRQIAASTGIQEGLRKAGVPVARLVPTRDGDLWTSFSDESFVLFEHVDGLRYRADPDQDRSAARVLARLHAAGVSAEQALGEDVFTLAADHIALLDKVLPDTADTTAVFEELLASVRRRALDAGFGALPTTAVHGDFNPWNLLFTADRRVAAVVDFDNCDVQSRLHDVAEALLTFCVLGYAEDSTTFAAVQPVEVDRAAVRRFLDAYEEVLPLTPVERECLPFALGAVWIELTCLGLLRHDFDTSPAYLDTCVRTFSVLTEDLRIGVGR